MLTLTTIEASVRGLRTLIVRAGDFYEPRRLSFWVRSVPLSRNSATFFAPPPPQTQGC